MRQTIYWLLTFLMVGICCYAEEVSSNTGVPAIPAECSYQVVLNGNQAGPFNISALQQMAAEHTITPSTLVWTDGMNSWQQAGQIEELKVIFAFAYSRSNNDSKSVDYYSAGYKAQMRSKFGRKLAGGITCAALGSMIFWPVGIPFLAYGAYSMTITNTLTSYAGTYTYAAMAIVAPYVFLSLGILFTLAGTILTPLCAVGFSGAARTVSEYRTATGGQKLFSFIRRTMIDIGYDRENEQVTVAMGIRL